MGHPAWVAVRGRQFRSFGCAFAPACGRAEPTHAAARHEWGTRQTQVPGGRLLVAAKHGWQFEKGNSGASAAPSLRPSAERSPLMPLRVMNGAPGKRRCREDGSWLRRSMDGRSRKAIQELRLRLDRKS